MTDETTPTTPTTPTITVTGIIKKVHFSNDKFSAGILDIEKHEPLDNDLKIKRTIGFAGNWHGDINDRITVIAEKNVDPDYGLQLKVKSVSLDFDMSNSGLISYLEKNKNFAGIGPTKARQIVNTLGVNCEHALSREPETISVVAKIPYETAVQICQQWNLDKEKNLALTELMRFNLSLSQARNIYNSMGVNAVALIKKNPYALIEYVDRIGFLTIDKVALKNGILPESDYRLNACIDYSMKKNEQNGNSCLTSSSLITEVNKNLCNEMPAVTAKAKACIQQQVEDFKIIKNEAGEKARYTDKIYYSRQVTHAMEKNVFNMLKEHNKYINADKFLKAETRIKRAVNTLNEDQLNAAANACITSCVITGGAGTGKTFTIQSIIEANPTAEFALCAPTGKAARRMSQSINDSEFEAQTIHRLLQYNPESKAFEINKFNKLDVDFLIVDEFSMVDVFLAYSLLVAVDPEKTKIIIVGDHNQLPSIGCGNVLRDIMNLNLLPVARLNIIMRQGGVLKNMCNKVLTDGVAGKSCTDETTKWIVDTSNKDSEKLKRKLLSFYKNKRFEANGFDAFRDVQIISPQRKGVIGTVELNKVLQQYFQNLKGTPVDLEPENKKYKIYKGDKVIQTMNDYKIDIMNGTLGIVLDIVQGDYSRNEDGLKGKREDANSKYYVIKFETGQVVRIKKGAKKAGNIELAYVLTIHKVQGSEFPCTIVLVHTMHSFMHHRGLFYTAVTRAKKTAIILGDRWGVMNCARTLTTNKRTTILPLLVRGE